jgi:hypothetical protein
LNDQASCCLWNRRQGKCNPKKKCADCTRKRRRNQCVKDGCCEWVGGSCSNKDKCIRRR